MATNIQYRLLQFESAPPAETWLRIAERLNEECLDDELKIAKKFDNFSQPAPATAWEAILSGINNADNTSDTKREQLPDESRVPVVPLPPASRDDQDGKVIPFRWRRLAVAAMICLAVTSLFYFVRQDNTSTGLAVTAVPAKRNAVPQPPVAITEDPVITRPPVTSMSLGGAGNVLFTKKRKASPVVEQASFELTDNAAETPVPEIRYANVDAADRVDATTSIAIPSQPIRDGEGNIILDEKLISAQDGNYVTVTCPNGQQTKISKKFLHALSYMNAGSADDEYMGISLQESSLWKWVFQEWRKKLLTQPSFIPSATNFLDIMELKEILHENF